MFASTVHWELLISTGEDHGDNADQEWAMTPDLSSIKEKEARAGLFEQSAATVLIGPIGEVYRLGESL